jgi:radical SAM protein with 4Fe4S-binding SPASM domain
MLSKQIQIYLKTTETCQLNCQHCFTSGANGAKIYFDPVATTDFFHRLKRDTSVNAVKILFHGGEPMLAPLEDMQKVYDLNKNLFPETQWGIQTNLVYKLDDKKRAFFKEAFLADGFGTSWDYDIRFENKKQLELWEKNVRLLKEDGHYMTMIVGVTKKLYDEKEPIDIINYAIDLGFDHVLFERITMDGNAVENKKLFPSNLELDDWFLKMWEQSIKNKTYEKIGNMFLSEVATAYVNMVHTANRCRNCEQSLLTINADGSIAGCPNTAPTSAWGNIHWQIKDSLDSKKRKETIACEMTRNPLCYECPVSDICNGDCHQLVWEEDICAAPKSLMKKLQKEGDLELYKKMIL